MRVVAVGGIAALGSEMVRARLECDCRLDVIPDAAQALEKRELLKEADVLIGWPLTREIVSAAPNVKLIQVAGAGVDGVPFDLLRENVTVANTFHHETSIAEYVLMAMLVFTRRPVEYDKRLREGNWWDSCIWGQAPNLGVMAGTTVLLIGTGHIARQVARRVRPFGVTSVAVSRDPSRPVDEIDEVIGYEAWHDKLPEVDWVVPACPLTPETEGLIGADELALMKPSACLINTARGKIVEEKPLYEALRERTIAGAAIDVWYEYPAEPVERCPPSRFPFESLDNVLMTPHVSGWTRRTVEGRMRDIAENINRLAQGRPLLNVVHPGSR